MIRLNAHTYPRFVNAVRGSTREKLQVTREMLMLCFTYFRVIPEFVDFLFAFGHQSHAQDPCFSSFRQRTRLANLTRTFDIHELAWSGNEIQMCYNLKSVERSGSDPGDWSIRPYAVHHTFDVKCIRANWIVIKGNKAMKDHIEQATGGRSCGDMSFETLDRAFAASLVTHLVFCDWAAEQWRWYINNLEDQFQNTSRKTLTAPVTFPFVSVTAEDEFRMKPRTDTQKTNESIVTKLSRASTMLVKKFSITTPEPRPLSQRIYTDPDSGLSQPLPPHIEIKDAPGPGPQPPQPNFENREEQDFSFAKLQKLQQIEEKAHEALLTLKMNISVIHQLKRYYDTILRSKNFPKEIVESCQDDLEGFELRVDGVLNDQQRQIPRLETLLVLLGNRKVLVR